MFKKIVLALTSFSGLLLAQTPEQIAQQLRSAEADFLRAQEMFIPWYTGPLIAGSANNIPKGHVNIQGYAYFTLNYAQFNRDRHSHSSPHVYFINPVLLVQWGITNWLDVTLSPQAYFKWSRHHSSQNFGDTSIQFGIPLVKQTQTIPAMRLVVGEVFPTGRYQGLSAHKGGLDATGAGVFSTTVGLNISKLLWNFPLHPMNLRLSMNTTIPDNRTSIQDFNTYGGGYGTDGMIHVGNTFSVDFGVEFSINQTWVISTDLFYTLSGKSSFSGDKGFTAAGGIASVGAPSSDQFSIAPAVEYNVSPNGGFIGGVWLPIIGRNSGNFISVILSYTQMF